VFVFGCKGSSFRRTLYRLSAGYVGDGSFDRLRKGEAAAMWLLMTTSGNFSELFFGNFGIICTFIVEVPTALSASAGCSRDVGSDTLGLEDISARWYRNLPAVKAFVFPFALKTI
jgi:hypothetical protein